MSAVKTLTDTNRISRKDTTYTLLSVHKANIYEDHWTARLHGYLAILLSRKFEVLYISVIY